MPTGTTTTGSLGDSQELIIDSARIVREFEGKWKSCTDVQRLESNTGLSWEEISLAALTAQAITETTDLDNPQAISDTLLQITPSMTGIHLCITDRVYRRMPKKVIAKMGMLGQNAMDRKKDEDYLAMFATATTTLAGTGTTFASGFVNAAARRITSNTTERAMGTVVTVLHGFVIKDIEDELRAGIGTYTIPKGLTEEVFKDGFRGTLASTNVYEDGNITINATPDARGATHAREAIIMVQGKSPWTEKDRLPGRGGGADVVYMYDEYGLGERGGGQWLFGQLADATAPTS